MRSLFFPLIVVALVAFACAGNAPAPTGSPPVTPVVVRITATPSPTPPATNTPTPELTATPTLEPTATSTPEPTQTPAPTPPISINSDCVGCPVFAPGATTDGEQSVLEAYKARRSTRHHPDPIILAACDKENDYIHGLGRIFGSPGRAVGETGVVAVEDHFVGVREGGTCYAITVEYTGWDQACRDTIRGSCAVGKGTSFGIITFRRVGDATVIRNDQYRNLVGHAKDSAYSVSTPAPTPTPEPTATSEPTPRPTRTPIPTITQKPPTPTPTRDASASLSAEEREKLRKELGVNFNMMFKSQELCHHAPFDGKRTQSDPAARLDAIKIVDGVVKPLRDLGKTAEDFTREEFAQFTKATQIASVELWQICAPPGVDVTADLLNSMPD